MKCDWVSMLLLCLVGLVGCLFIVAILSGCWPPNQPPVPPLAPVVTPSPMSSVTIVPPTPTAAGMAPGAFSLEGLAGMKVAGGDCSAIIGLDSPPMPLVDGMLFYITVNRLTGKSVELQAKVHGAWWDVDRQAWQDGWVEKRCLVWR